MKKPLFLFHIVIFLLTGISAHTQHGQLRFGHVGTREGLSHSNVICILRDSRGFMWFGTRDGLNRYDGYTFTTFRNDPQDTNSISNNTIISMIEDNEGFIWIATWGGGLNRYDRNTEKFLRFQHDPAVYTSLASNLLNTLMLDHNNVLWIGTEDAGFDRFDRHGRVFVHTPNNNTVQLSSVKSMYEDGDHRVWIGTNENGLHIFDPANNTDVAFYHSDKDIHSLSSNSIKVIFADSRHQLWIGTRGAGLNRFEPATNSFQQFRHNANPGSLCHDYVVAINEDAHGNLWIGTENGGLSILPPGSEAFKNYTQDDIDPESLSSNSIWTIYRDIHNDMWVGTYSGDINFWSSANNQFAHFRHTSSPFSLSHNKVLSILQDSHSNIWVGTDGGGLNHYDAVTKKFTPYLHNDNNKNSICGNFVLSLAEDRYGNIWIGTWGSGVTIFDPRKNVFRHLKNIPGDPGSVSSNNIYGIYRDRDGHMWLATYYGGLDRYVEETNTFIRYQHVDNDPSSISSNKINSIFQDSRGDFWVSTDGNGLDKFDPVTGKFKHFVHDEKKNSISNNNVGKIYEDAAGNLWIGTMSGLNYFNTRTGTFEIFRMEQGMPNDAVFGIIADDQQNLWLSTNKGLSKFDPVSRRFHNYTEADGLQSDEFKLNAAYKTSKGSLLFGGNNGFNEFDPATLYTDTYAPPLVMSNFMIMNQPVSPGTDKSSVLNKPIAETHSLRLPYSSSVISFEFTALHYRSGNKKQYSYMLQGFDHTWNDVGSKRSATYTNLDPGKYVFLVRTRDGMGMWSKNILRMDLSIVPPFWMTWWFRCLAIAAWIAAVVIIYRRRVNAYRLQKEKLQELVDQQTRELKEVNAQEHEARMDAERARHEADQANRAKSIFLATMSHEIRTPMNGVIGMASLLEATELTPEQRSYTETISTCGESLLKVINDILDFSKIESGNFELEYSEVNVRQIIEEVLEVFAAKSAQTGIDLLYDLGSGVPETIMGDSHRLRQILLNLVSNATKFTNHGEVLIEVKLLSLVDRNAHLEFTVRDTGIGIPSDKVNRLFQAFTQVDSSTTRKYGGTGLGLVICEKLVNLMGGKISVSSVEGSGTSFSFSLKTQTVASVTNAISPFKMDVQGKHILIVDDNATNLKILKSQMVKLGATCYPVPSGAAALAVLSDGNTVDLVLADMQMPGMDGIQLAQQIRKQYSDVPVILLTSLGEDVSKQYPGLFHSVLIKPVRQHLLHQHILNALNIGTTTVNEAVISNVSLHGDFAERNPLRIMLVEDNLINQLLATTILTKLGYKPHIANNGREAIDLLSQQAFDLILMDMQMPEMDGIEATKYIRQHFEVQPVIIAMTANAMREDREICLQAGMNDYLSKPVKPEDLMMMMEKWRMGSAA
jgi:signal transduction histidine kinase/CheY-like chemotaxis protein/ligand-binding sensor domain-containing protein